MRDQVMKTGHLKIARTVSQLREEITRYRSVGETLALVPTMGFLHDGHLSLMRQGRSSHDRVCATLFVNPRQFSPNEDLESYPRDEAADIDKLRAEGVDLLFAPSVEEMYPVGASTTVSVAGLTDSLCGVTRPGFFDGVATVVTKLLLQALPDAAIFGEKDYQQLLVIKRFAKDLDIPVEILGGPTVREADGLALSSRNAYLDADQRARAPELFSALRAAAKAIASREDAPANALGIARHRIEAAGFGPIDYLEHRDAETLSPARSNDRPSRLFTAAWLGSTRLIDNVAVSAE
jgi:pantoate--beta-alanine ligase